MCIDSHVDHAFMFTPSFSIYLTCDTEEEIETLYEKMMENGTALMPIDNYGFSKKFGWLNDQFGDLLAAELTGVSWQFFLVKGMCRIFAIWIS